jgi:hypothetical protein
LELNCHLHPFDAIASVVRSTLKKLQKPEDEPPPSPHKLFGADCFAANMVLGLHKMRYKAGKGDPTGFVQFLRSHGLPVTVFPRYRGNRLHVLFHTGGLIVHHHSKLLEYLK